VLDEETSNSHAILFFTAALSPVVVVVKVDAVLE
jgi:hypothetical protein